MKAFRHFSLKFIKPLSLFLLAVFLLPNLQAQMTTPFVGVWQGAIEVQSTQLEVIFELTESDGQVLCHMDVPLQGAKEIPADQVLINSQAITIHYPMLNANYQGTLAQDGQSISGTWTQSGQSLPLNLIKKENKEEVTLLRPQEPKPPFPYKSEDHFFENRGAKIFLQGTLTSPPGEGPFPTAILISGSGPQDRNEEILGHKPFWVIADYLTRKGIAVFRYDDRGVGKSKGNFNAATSVHFAKDVEAAMDFLKTQSVVDKNKIGLIGHSEGGIIAPMVAAERSDVAFAILLAAPGVNLKEVILEQSSALSRAEGTAEEKVIRDSILQNQMLELFVKETNLKQREEKLRSIALASYEALSEEEQKASGNFETMFAQQLQGMSTPWMQFLLTYEPRTALEKVSCPVLALNGGLDLQVSAKTNFPVLQKALEKAPCTDYQILEMPDHNHLFQKAKTGAFSEYAALEETFSEEAMEVMMKWINKRFGK